MVTYALPEARPFFLHGNRLGAYRAESHALKSRPRRLAVAEVRAAKRPGRLQIRITFTKGGGRPGRTVGERGGVSRDNENDVEALLNPSDEMILKQEACHV